MSANRSKMERNREKLIQDRLQVLLGRMLQDEDNKYCIDCDAKGPRWASWNIGIFLCIRCAGIHRNLGVHISRVKSVNLDSWTPHQVASMQIMGNSKGRAVYEARVPEDWRRPQADSGLEAFIRNKYEKKKFIAREWTPVKPPDHPLGWAKLIEAEKQKKDIRNIVLPSRAQPSPEHKQADTKTPVPVKETAAVKDSKANKPPASPAAQSAVVDLLGLTTGSAPDPTPVTATTTSTLTSNLDLLSLGASPAPVAVTAADNANEFDDFVSVTSNNQTFDNKATNGGSGGNQMSKDSIMALFNKPTSGMAASTVLPTSAVPPMSGLNPLQANVPQIQPFQAFQLPDLNVGAFPTQQQAMPGLGAGFLNQQIRQFGLSQQPAQQQQQPLQSSTLNNPFLGGAADFGLGALNGGSSSSAQKQSWGFN